jgi:hypothetical protein
MNIARGCLVVFEKFEKFDEYEVLHVQPPEATSEFQNSESSAKACKT